MDEPILNEHSRLIREGLRAMQEESKKVDDATSMTDAEFYQFRTRVAASSQPGEITQWLSNIAMSAAVVALFIAWKLYGVEQAGNLLRFWLLLIGLIGLVLMFSPARGKVSPRIKGFRIFNGVMRVMVIGALAWFGHFFLAAIYLSGVIGLITYLDQFDDHGLPKRSGNV